MGQEDTPTHSLDATGQLRERRDDSLIPFLQKGVRSAVSELERRYGDALRRRATRLLDDPALAEDVVQDLMLHCCKGEEGRLPERKLRAWLYRALRNRCTDELRKRKVRVARRIDDGRSSVIGDMPPDPRTLPSSKVAKFEQAAGLMRVIDDFDPRMREILILRYFENRPRAEIATELGISESVVKSRLVKAVALLRTKLVQVRGDSQA